MKIFSHRGYTKEATENSLVSIVSALKKGYSVEVDIRATADDCFILNHDSVIENKNNKIKIKNKGVQEIRNYVNDNASKRIDTLEEALHIFAKEHSKNTEMALHLKDLKKRGLEKKLIGKVVSVDDVYNSCDLLSNIFVFDVTIERAKRLKKIEPKIRTGVSVGESKIFPDDIYPTIYDYEKIGKKSIFDIVWADEWTGGLYERSFFEKCKHDNYIVYCVSPELHSETSPAHPKSNEYYSYWNEIIENGAHGICTNYPKLLSEKHGLS